MLEDMRNFCWFILMIGLPIYEVSSNDHQPCPDGTNKLVIGGESGSYNLFCKQHVTNPDHYRCQQISPIDDYICSGTNTKCGSDLISYLSSNAFYYVCKNLLLNKACFKKDTIAYGLITPLKFICVKPNNKLQGHKHKLWDIVGSACRSIGSGWKHSNTYVSEDCYDVSMNYEICKKDGSDCIPRLRFLCKSNGGQDDIPDDYVICISDKKPGFKCANVAGKQLTYKCLHKHKNTEGCVEVDKNTQKVYRTKLSTRHEQLPMEFNIESELEERKENKIYVCTKDAARDDESCESLDSKLGFVKYICSKCDNGGKMVKFDKDYFDGDYPFVCNKMVLENQCTRVTEFDEFHCGREEKVCTRGIARVTSLIQRKNMKYFCYLHHAAYSENKACEEINPEDMDREMHLEQMQVCESPEPTNIENVAEDCTPVSPGLVYKTTTESKNCIKIKKGYLCDVTGCLIDVKYLCDANFESTIESQTTATMKICKKNFKSVKEEGTSNKQQVQNKVKSQLHSKKNEPGAANRKCSCNSCFLYFLISSLLLLMTNYNFYSLG